MILKMHAGVRSGKTKIRLVPETAISREVEIVVSETVPQESANLVG